VSVKHTVTILSGVRKAAILTLLVGEQTAAQLFTHLNEEEIEQIAREVAIVGPVASDTGNSTLEEFHTMWRASEYMTRGGVDYAQKLLVKSLGPEMARRVLDP
jgi:flagellar motor switch protein FliG